MSDSRRGNVRSRSTPPNSKSNCGRPRRTVTRPSDDPLTRRSLEDGVRGEGLGVVREEDSLRNSPNPPRSPRPPDDNRTTESRPSETESLKFPPHPPPCEPPSLRSLPIHKLSQLTSVDSEDVPTKNDDDDVPFSQEETSSISESSTWSLPHVHSASDSGIHSRLSREYSMPNLNTLNQGLDMDGKFKQDILHGLEYFDQRNKELKKLNKRLIRDVERMTEANKHLEVHLEELSTKYHKMIDENEELKIQLDQMTKENIRHEEQAMHDWENKVDLEEKYLLLKAGSEKEMTELKNKIEQQSKQLDGSCCTEVRRQLEQTIAQLQDDIRKMNAEKDLSGEATQRLRSEMKDLQEIHRQKATELEAQYKRFLSLKKSYNDLLEEHEKMKSSKVSGSSTWPSNKTIETVHLIDLPSKPSKASYQTQALGSSHLPKTRTNAAVRGKAQRPGIGRSENLPPVTSQAQ